MSFLDGYFRITERDSTVSREVMGGITTFLAMAYRNNYSRGMG